MIYPTINKKQQELEVVENETIGKSIFPTVSKPVIPSVQPPQPVNPIQPTTPTTTTPTGLNASVPKGMDADVVLLAKAIRQHESGNRAVLPGEGAEVGGASRYQYTHGTWKEVAQKYLGNANAPMTLENENKATYLRLLDWKKKGYNPAQIASMWNAGEGRPDAYKENWRGTNKWGVKYDTPAYVDKVYNTYKGLKDEYVKTYKEEGTLSADEEFVENILKQKRKGGELSKEEEAEIKRQIEINKNSLMDVIGQAEELGVDKDLATRLVEREEFGKLAELMEASGKAKKMGDASKNGFKFAFNLLTEAEQMLGKLYGQTLAMGSKDEKARMQSEQDLKDQTVRLIQEIRKNKEQGKDTTKMEKMLSDLTNMPSTSFEDLYDVQHLTKGQVIGASAQTVLDALGGSFTKTGTKAITSKIAGKSAQTFAPNLAKGLVKQSGSQILGNVARTAGVLGKEGAQIGLGYGVSQGMMEGKGVGETLVQGGLGAVMGGVFGASLGAMTSGIGSSAYNKSVNKNLSELSTQTSKVISEKLNTLQKAGVKISDVYVKPSATDINHGYKTTNIAKYDVGGSIDTALPKVQTKLKNYTDQLNEYIKLRGEEPTLNYGNIIDELDAKYLEKTEKKLGFIGDTSRELEKLKSELKLKYGENWRETPIGFTDVVDDKRSAGIKAIFNHDPLKKVEGAGEKVWNDFYSKLKTTLEKESPKEFADINKAISELIPIEHAYVRRVRQLDKNNVFSIYDFIGATGALTYNPSALAIPLVSRLMKSPRVANILMKSGNIEKALGAIPKDELAKWGIQKYGSKYSFEGMDVKKMNLKPQEVRSTLIKIKKYFQDKKTLPGFIDLGAEVLPKKQKVVENIKAKKWLNDLAKEYKTENAFEKALDVLYEDSWRGKKNPKAEKLKEFFDGYIFHGTDNSQKIKSSGFKKGEYFNSGIYFSDTPDIAIGYKNQNRSGGNEKGVFAIKAGELKIKEIDYKDFREINKGLGGEELVESLKKSKYDGIKSEGETLVWNVEKIKERKTLADIFKEAKKEGFITIEQLLKVNAVLGLGLSAGALVASLIASKKGKKGEATNEPELKKESVQTNIEAKKEIKKLIPEKIKQNKIAERAISHFPAEEVELASRILRQENNPQDTRFKTNITSSNKNPDGTYDEGLFQHNSKTKTDKETPVEERVYSGTQKDINNLFVEEYGRNYDVFNEDDSTKATILWIKNIKERIKSNWDIEPDDEMVMYFYHKGSGNFSLTMKNNLLEKLYKHPYITDSLDIFE